MINYGVVSVGYFGAGLARFMGMRDSTKITCVYGPEDGENTARELQCIDISSLDALVSSKLIDCVIVTTPNYLRKGPVIKAAKNKKHVFYEKPITLSYENCVNIARACEEASVTFMTGHIMNFFDGVQYVWKLIKEGIIDEILSCRTKRSGWENK